MTDWAAKSSAHGRAVIEFFWRQLAVCSSVTLWRGQWGWFSIWIDNENSVCLATLAAGEFVLRQRNLRFSTGKSDPRWTSTAQTRHSSYPTAFILLTLNLGGLAFQLGAVPDSSLESSADCIRFQIEYFSLIWREQSEHWPTKMVGCSKDHETRDHCRVYVR